MKTIIINILIAMAPVLVFFVIQMRYSLFNPNMVKQFHSFLGGVVSALIIIFFSGVVYTFLSSNSTFVDAFVKAAMLEKSIIAVMIILVFRHYDNFSMVEAVLSGMAAGFGFSVVENLFYALNYGSSVTLIRLIFSVPLHMTTCGIMGFFLGEYIHHTRTMYKFTSLVQGLLTAFFLHGVFDYLLLSQGRVMYAASPLLLLLVFIQEILLSKSQTIPGLSIIEGLGIFYDEWQVLNRQEKYDRWIKRSMGKSGGLSVPLFSWRPHPGDLLFIAVLVSLALVATQYKSSILRNFRLTVPEENLLLIMLPLSISTMVVLVHAVNKEFFASRELRIPIISNVEYRLNEAESETYVTYDITPYAVFLNTFAGIGQDNASCPLHIEIPSLGEMKAQGKVVWEQHVGGKPLAGSLVRLTDISWSFMFSILFQYQMFRIKKGIVFNLKLPGFNEIKRFFTHPVSAMGEEKMYRQGEIIYKEGDASHNFYYLKRGLVEFYKQKNDNEKIVINRISKGSIFGEMSVFASGKRTSTARAVEDSLIAFSDRKHLYLLVQNNTEFAIELFETLANRVEESQKSLLKYIHDIERQKRDNIMLYHSLSMMLLTLVSDTEADIRISIFDKIKFIIANINEETAEALAELLQQSRKNMSGAELAQIIDRLYDALRLKSGKREE